MNRRYAIQPSKTPAMTGGEDEPTRPCLGNPTPYDVLIETTKTTPEFKIALREARRMCGECPIRLQCWAENRDEQWVQALATRDGRPRPLPTEGCGTKEGVQRHRRRHEPPCLTCLRRDNARRVQQRAERVA